MVYMAKKWYWKRGVSGPLSRVKDPDQGLQMKNVNLNVKTGQNVKKLSGAKKGPVTFNVMAKQGRGQSKEPEPEPELESEPEPKLEPKSGSNVGKHAKSC